MIVHWKDSNGHADADLLRCVNFTILGRMGGAARAGFCVWSTQELRVNNEDQNSSEAKVLT